MIFALLFFAVLSLVVTAVPGALLGLAFVALSTRLPLWVRCVLLPVVAAATSVAWAAVLTTGNHWWPAAALLSFAATAAAGAALLLHQTRRALPPRPAPVWTVR
ncbi:hypothetical protein LG634_22815 [Streptomyces bambusae]|uniref:hypothetical protein n=1 Tax=Streptomyces bambusae TaxID=1550616 RepID=UPI001CFE14D2|nr:hypothetical protein [Streptomyces bambusae]MCB5167649.1 hypothetical protein [Streptomyces bambusae]